MTRRRPNPSLSRGAWTLARYLNERSPAPLPPVVRTDDDALHVAKLAIAAAMPRAVYVVDEHNHYLGTITDKHLTREIFVRLQPALYLQAHARGVTTTLLRLEETAAALSAGSLMQAAPPPISDTETIIGAMRLLYKHDADELPVVNAASELVGVIRALDILREWTEDTLLVQLGDETDSFY